MLLVGAGLKFPMKSLVLHIIINASTVGERNNMTKKKLYFDSRIDDENQGILNLGSLLDAIREHLIERDGFDETYITVCRVYLTDKEFESLPEE